MNSDTIAFTRKRKSKSFLKTYIFTIIPFLIIIGIIIYVIYKKDPLPYPDDLVRYDKMVKIDSKNRRSVLYSFPLKVHPFGKDNKKRMEPFIFKYDYWIDTTEITQLEYYTVTKQKPWRIKYDSIYSPTDMEERSPAWNVTWYEAVKYCNMKSEMEFLEPVYSYVDTVDSRGNLRLKHVIIDLRKNGYRLPTIHEWEYACRAESETKYYWGPSIDNFHDSHEKFIEQFSLHAVWYHNSPAQMMHDYLPGGVKQVASRKANKFGLYDMIGNLNEYTTEAVYEQIPIYELDPRSYPIQIITYDGKMYKYTRRFSIHMKGGSWYTEFSDLEKIYRRTGPCNKRSFLNGFRTVRLVSE